jgi:signal transduction histidine kinase
MSRELGMLLRKSRTTVLQRWQARVAEMTQAMQISRIELLDHIPTFLEDLISLFEGPPPSAETIEIPAQASAPMHGAQRLNVGFDVDEVIREYGILADVLLEVIDQSGVDVPVADQRRLVSAVNAGAAEAVREYVRRRDEELLREQAQHRAFIAHELRTPLATALAALTLLTQQRPDLGEGRPTQLLDRSLRRIRDLIDQVLIAGSLGAGVEPTRTDLDLAALVREVEEMVRPEAESRDITLVLDLPATLYVKADARFMQSAVANLLRNAVKYTRAASTVRVALRESDDAVTLEIQDGCGGITDANWASIFEPYARGESVAKRQRDGLGLGLAIAKQATEAHGGTLSVRNANSGCVFELRLPRNVVAS